MVFEQLLDNVFIHNTTLWDALSIFLVASKVIRDAVFLYFSLINLRNGHFCITICAWEK